MADELVLVNTGGAPVEVAGVEVPPGEAARVSASDLPPGEYQRLCVDGPVAVMPAELYGPQIPPPDVLRAYGLVEFAERVEEREAAKEGKDAGLGADSGSAGGAEGPAEGDSGSAA